MGEWRQEAAMTTTGNERYWGIVAPLMPAGMIAEAAKQQEETGLLGTFAAQVYGPPWTALAAAATTTTRLQLASGIAQAFVRSPFETAMTAMDLDRISGGRFVLGLGPTVRSWSEGAYGVPGYGRPLAHLREAVEVIRLVIAKSHTGELEHFKGSYYNFDWSEFQGAPPPLRAAHLAGGGPRAAGGARSRDLRRPHRPSHLVGQMGDHHRPGAPPDRTCTCRQAALGRARLHLVLGDTEHGRQGIPERRPRLRGLLRWGRAVRELLRRPRLRRRDKTAPRGCQARRLSQRRPPRPRRHGEHLRGDRDPRRGQEEAPAGVGVRRLHAARAAAAHHRAGEVSAVLRDHRGNVLRLTSFALCVPARPPWALWARRRDHAGSRVRQAGFGRAGARRRCGRRGGLPG